MENREWRMDNKDYFQPHAKAQGSQRKAN
jgi:hypothetical protein